MPKSRKAKASRRTKARPRSGTVHFILKNIPRQTWKKFRDTREDPRFDLLAFIESEVRKATPPPITIQPEGIRAPGEKNVTGTMPSGVTLQQ